MEIASRHIKKLKIHTPSIDGVKKAQSLIAEAFNNSTFPDQFNHRLVLVRRLNLGRFNIEISPQVLSTIISDNVKNLVASAVCVDYSDSPDSDIVWFSDNLTPHFLLIEKKLLGIQTSGWYWKVIKKRFYLADSENIPLLDLIKMLGVENADKLVFVSLLSFLFKKKCLPDFLEQLDIQSTDFMLQCSGINLSELKGELISKSIVNKADVLESTKSVVYTFKKELRTGSSKSFSSDGFQSLVAEKVSEWGSKDRRSFFLIYHSLLLTNPALLHSTGKIDFVFHIIETLAKNNYTKGSDPYRVTKGSDPNVGGTDPGIKSLAGKAAKGVLREYDSEYGLDIRNPVGSPVALEGNESQKSEKSRSVDFGTNNDGLPIEIDEGNVVSTQALDIRDFEQDRSQNITQEDEQNPRKLPFEIYEKDSDQTIAMLESATPSPFCGLGYFIRLLEIIKIDELLDLNPVLAECNFPAALIKKVAGRCGITDDDPLLGFLGEVLESDNVQLHSYIIPDQWLTMVNLNQPLELQKDEMDRNRQRIVDVDGLIIAQWVEQMPSNMEAYLKSHRYFEAVKPNLVLTMDEIIRNSLVFIYRYLRRISGISLRQLVCKPGEYTMTKTHVDFVFEGSSVDVRIRRSGLDINPGWLSWIGRVVSFQYRFSDGGNDVR